MVKGRRRNNSALNSVLNIVGVGVGVCFLLVVVVTVIYSVSKRRHLRKLRQVHEQSVYGAKGVAGFIEDEVNQMTLKELQKFKQKPRFLVEYPKVKTTVESRIKELTTS